MMDYYYKDEYEPDNYELEPCPFCCSTLVDLWGYHVECESCGAAGPKLLNWKTAIKAWNEMPRLTGGKLNKQRSRWKSRLRADKKATERAQAEAKKNRENSPEAKRDREYSKWVAERAAWLASPINESKAS